MYDNLHYAVAAEPKNVPACGLRLLPLKAHTEPTLMTESIGIPRMTVGLTPDSAVSLQYLGDLMLGADIGLRTPEGGVVRYRTDGGTGAPWQGYGWMGRGTIVLAPVDPPAAYAPYNLTLDVLPAGSGARKVAARLRIRDTEAVAVFIAPEGSPDDRGCAVPGAAGAGITPRPTDGEHFVLLSFNGLQIGYMGAPRTASFGGSGELTGRVGELSLSGPAYELAGNADASIGRVNVTGPRGDGRTVTRSLPYAVAQPGAVLPTKGRVQYELVTATSAVVEVGDSAAVALTGSVATASLEVFHGEHPIGTASDYYGTARLQLTGNLQGQRFGSESGRDHTARIYGEGMRGDLFEGALSGADGGYAVVNYRGGVAAGAGPLSVTLLFKRKAVQAAAAPAAMPERVKSPAGRALKALGREK